MRSPLHVMILTSFFIPRFVIFSTDLLSSLPESGGMYLLQNDL